MGSGRHLLNGPGRGYSGSGYGSHYDDYDDYYQEETEEEEETYYYEQQEEEGEYTCETIQVDNAAEYGQLTQANDYLQRHNAAELLASGLNTGVHCTGNGRTCGLDHD
jgi:hypothetical protein